MVRTTTFIYALCEPGTRTIRYIGKADDVKQRLRQHRCEARQGECRTHKDRWLASLEKAGTKPELVILSEVLRENWKTEEMWYISAARMLGMNLVNGTDGGDGIDGYRHTVKTKALLSKKGLGRKATDETRGRMSEAKSGNNHPFFGKNLTASHCANLSKSMIGRPLTPAHIKARSKGRIGTKTKGSSSIYPGVFQATKTGKWIANWPNHVYLGSFNSEAAAHEAVIKKQTLS